MILDVKTLDDDVPAYLVSAWNFNLINPYYNKHNQKGLQETRAY